MNLFKHPLSLCACLLSFSLSAFAGDISPKQDQWDGKQYVKTSDLQYQWATSYIEKLRLQGWEKILDIGCGDGRVTARIAQSIPNGSLLGIDPSDSMLQMAEDLQDKIHLPNLHFTKRDAQNLGFENEFDYVVSFSCFHWIHDHLAALQSIEKALKPNGKVFLYFTPDHGRNRIDHAITAVVTSPKWAHFLSDFKQPFFLITPLQFLQYAYEAGLHLKRMENITVDETFANRGAFADWMSGWMSHLKLLPKELHRDFLEEIVDCYVKHHPIDAENKLHYIGYWIEVELFKQAE